MEDTSIIYCLKLITGETLLSYVSAPHSNNEKLMLYQPMVIVMDADVRVSDYRIWVKPWTVPKLDESAYFAVSTFSILSFFGADSRFIDIHKAAYAEYFTMTNIVIQSLLPGKSDRIN